MFRSLCSARENNVHRTPGLRASRSVPGFSYQTRKPDVDMNGIKELIGSLGAAIGKADMPVAVFDTHGVLFAGQHLPTHFTQGALPGDCHSTTLALPETATPALQQLFAALGMTPPADTVQARHHRCADGLEVICLTLHGFTLPAPLYAPLDLLQQQVKELQALNNGLQTIISLQSQVEKSLWERHLQHAAVLENASAAYICLDERTTVVSWNHAAANMLGWRNEEVLGKPLARILFQHPQNFSLLHLHNALTLPPGRAVRSQEWTLQNRFGHELTVEVCTYPHTVDGQHYLNIFLHDITRRKLTEQALEQETRRDLLTGLLNHKGLYEALQQQAGSVAVLFIDIDGFKAINDDFGHDAGDMLLRQIAQRLRHGVRSSDGVARLAGDEFVLLLPGISTARHAGDIATKLLRKLSQPYQLAGHHARIGASIGIHLAMAAADTPADTIIAAADRAMYEAKRRGKGGFHVLDDPA